MDQKAQSNAEYWRQIIDDAKSSSLSVRGWCRQKGIKTSSLPIGSYLSEKAFGIAPECLSSHIKKLSLMKPKKCGEADIICGQREAAKKSIITLNNN